MAVLAHISDPHLGPLPPLSLRELRLKRLVGLANWQRRHRVIFRPAVLEALTADLRAAGPDHVAVTGDLTNLGLAAEFEQARKWLAEIGPAEDVTVIPGNHDAYMRGSSVEFSRIWQDHMAGDAASAVTFPSVRRRGSLALVSVSSAVPSPPFMAIGRMGEEQAAKLADLLALLGREGLFRVVLIHHPPHAGGAARHKRLTDGERFRAVVAGAGAELILHGHNHVTSIASVPGPEGAVPVIGAPSASMQPSSHRSGAAYHLFRIERIGERFSCTMTERGIRVRGGPVETLSETRLGGEDQPTGTLTQA
jgi:3',5'-cyclic AMP phosphodiesterase CpdA